MNGLLKFAILACSAMANPTPQLNDLVKGLALVGDGDPHQAYMYKQVTDTNTCQKERECAIGSTEAKTYTVGWTGGASAGWITGGFAVSESVSTGQVGTCSGEPGDVICVWYRTAHTAYTVQEYAYDRRSQEPADGEPLGDPYVIWSPNSDSKGYGFVCALNDECQSRGDEWWGSQGPAGGPQDYPPGAGPWM